MNGKRRRFLTALRPNRIPRGDQCHDDAQTQEPVVVSNDGDAGAYIMVVLGQLDRVTAVLREDGIGFWVNEEAISLNGKPEIAVINFGRGVDAARVQQILDRAA